VISSAVCPINMAVSLTVFSVLVFLPLGKSKFGIYNEVVC